MNKTRLCCLVLLISAYQSFSQFKDLKFRHYAKKEGLSSSNVTAFAQTADGYMWIGTSDGLNRFDGYEFKTYKNDPEDSASLCDNHITSMYVDHLGDLWIGTETNGLSRFGNSEGAFEHFEYRDYLPSSLSNYFVTSIVEDSNDQLWIGTIMGLNLFQREDKTFKRYFHETSILVETKMIEKLEKHHLPTYLIDGLRKLDGRLFTNYQHFFSELGQFVSPHKIQHHSNLIIQCASRQDNADHIIALTPDDKGNLWIAYQQDGLGYFNPNTNSLERFRHDPNDPNSLSSNEINALLLKGNELWVGMKTGQVNILDLENQIFHEVDLPYLENVESIMIDNQDAVWIADENGLLKQDKTSGNFYHYKNEPRNNWSLSTNAIKRIFEDSQQNIWVGGEHGGVNLSTSNDPFILYRNNPSISNSLTKNSVSSILEDANGNVWIGYYTNGADFWDKSRNTIAHYAPDESNPYSLGKGTVFDIFEDREGQIWFGTYEGGLQLFDPKKNNFISFRNDPGDPESISGNDVRSIDQDSEGNLWLAVHGQGVNCFSPLTYKAKHYKANYLDWQNSLANDWVFTITIDKQQNVWVGSVWGVSVLRDGAENFVSYNDENSTLSHNRVRSIYQDNSGELWIGTENGLNRLLPDYPYFEVFLEKHGLPNNNVAGIQEDKWGDIWISTKNGISNYDFSQRKFTNYNDLDGGQSSEFFEGAIEAGQGSVMYFGGPNGLVSFHSDHIEEDSSMAPLVLSEIRLFDRILTPGREEAHYMDSPYSAENRLGYDQNEVGFKYVAIDYRNPENIKYAHKLVGYENEWNYVSNEREVIYKNLEPGDYQFYLKATNGVGIWGDESLQYQFRISPPFWKTPSAYLLYIMVLGLVLYIYRSYLLKQERYKNKLKLQEISAREKHEMDKQKIRFFSHISHEFRSPLNLIKGPLEQLIENDDAMSPSLRMEYFRLISRNSRRLMRLIDQLLDISQLDAGYMRLKVERSDVVEFCRNISDAFVYQADKHQIDFSFQSNIGQADVFFDTDKLEKILYNLLSNAFKSVLDGGEISIQLEVTDTSHEELPQKLASLGSQKSMIRLKVEDNGTGMTEEHVRHLFNMFEQKVDRSRFKTGSGIGMAYVYQLVRIHQGTIGVTSEIKKGSSFVIWVPVDASCFEPDHFSMYPFEIEERVKDIRAIVSSPVIFEQEEANQVKGLPKLLLIEKDEDQRRFIKLNLRHDFIIYEADNGIEGFTSIMHIMPDIIITDLIVADMDGIEICKKLKNDKRTDHIPVILMSTKSSESDILKGLSTGADDYFVKPFHIQLLKSKALNILNSRKKIKRKYITEDGAQLSENVSRTEDDFLKDLMDMIEKQMHNEYFGPDSLATYMNLSRSQLYKKVRTLTGLSVSILIRNSRLEKGANLLINAEYTIAEIAYSVGFNDPGYFTKCFKEKFGVSPSDFVLRHQ